MPFAVAIIAIIAAHMLGYDPIHNWLTGRGSRDLALQGALHAGLLLGVAGAAISFSNRPRSATPLLFIGCLAVLGLLLEDLLGISGGARGWSKDALDMGQRVGLLMLFSTASMGQPDAAGFDSTPHPARDRCACGARCPPP